MDALLDFVGEIYEASCNTRHWDSVAESLCRLLNARSGGIFMEDYEGKIRGIIGAYGLPKPVRVAYRFGMSRYDYTFQLQRRDPPGKARQLIDAQAIRHQHPLYYRLILKPNDIGFLCSMSFYNNEEWHVGLALHRSFNAAPFSSEDCTTLQRLYPHFKRAMRIHKELQQLRTRQQNLSKTLSRLTLGVIIVSPDREVTYCNPVAEALLAQQGALIIDRHGRLKAHYPEENQRLQTLIAHLASVDKQDITTRDEAIGFHHPDKEHAINVMLATLNEASDSMHPPGYVALYLCDPESALNLSGDALRKLYNMTPAEARVAIALVNGLSPREISERHCVSIETVRSQLKSIYSKMGVSKQQDVIRVLLSGRIEARSY